MQFKACMGCPDPPIIEPTAPMNCMMSLSEICESSVMFFSQHGLGTWVCSPRLEFDFDFPQHCLVLVQGLVLPKSREENRALKKKKKSVFWAMLLC